MNNKILVAARWTLLAYTCFGTFAHAQVTGVEVAEGLGLTDDEIERMESGEVLAFSDSAYENTNRELAADAIILIDKTVEEILAELNDETTLLPKKVELGGGRITGEADFAAVGYDDSEFEAVEALFSAKPGKDFNLSESEYTKLKTKLDVHRKSDRASKISVASDAMRDILVERYNRYQAAGLDGIDVFHRPRSKQLDTGDELRVITAAFQAFSDDFPEYVDEIQNYPTQNGCCEHEFRWLKLKVRKQPVFVLTHKIQQANADLILITERFFYVNSADVNTAQITLAWLPYEEGTYMGVAVSASADVLDSTMGRMLRPLGRNKAKDFVSEVMEEIQTDLENGVEN
ncbi:MAG: hypothetical protein OEV34_10275 [Gammaproteobacteria bacterium]|jgi:hypothetical protein|nr:hypothetical protein [Gammaproteobacteria bacterium]